MTDNVTTGKSAGLFQIQKRGFQEWMVLIIALWPFLMNILLAIPSVPNTVKYIADGVLVLFALKVFAGKKLRIRRAIFPFVFLIGTFLIYTLLIYVFQFQSPFYYLWGIRNNFRSYIAFFIFVELTSQKEANNWYNLLDKLFWINFVLSLFQFFFMGIRQDYLGGVFGIKGATNGYTQIFMYIVVAKSLLCYQEKKEKAGMCLAKCTAALLIAAMAELKFFFVVMVLLLVMTSLLTHFNWKKVGAYFSIGIAIAISISLLENWFGFEDFFSVENLWRLATQENYSSGQDLNRLSAIGTLSKTIVTKPLERLFGLGLGNCDTSSFAICNTPFFRRYSFLHYIWFSAPMMFLETGYIGLLMYLGFFVLCFFQARKRKEEGTGNKLFCQMAMIMSVLCCIYAFYNSALRIEAAYMIYFVLALPFIKQETPANTVTNDTHI